MMDKATLQVLANHTRAAVENMAQTLHRTAHSAFVKETEDFTVMLMDRQGKVVSVPMESGATWYPGLDAGRAFDLGGPYRPGEIWFTNDTYSGFVATHTPDTHLWLPVFHKGELICFVGGHVHNTDMGGAVPASLSRSLTEIHQEGIRFAPTRLAVDGVFDKQIIDIMALNVRKPDLNMGDLKALAGALTIGERKVQAMIAKFGSETFVSGLQSLMDYAESQARDILCDIPDGTYVFHDYVDEDGVGGNPCRLKLSLQIDGDSAVLDFTGSDPQLQSSINVPTGSHPRHTLLLVGVYYVLYTLNPQILLNYGITRPFTCIAPEGTVLNPIFPAAVGMRSLTCARLRSLVFGAFNRALPDRLPAAPAGSSSIVNVMLTDEVTAQPVIAAINPVVGGGGGMPHRDGPNGSGADSAYLKNTPVEITEAEVPIRFRRYGLMPDTGGAGYNRGGLATVMEFQVFSPNTRITVRNRDRTRFRPWGTLGGKAAEPSDLIVNPGAPGELKLGNTDIAIIEPGDVLHIRSPGGGGFGNPFDREVERVLLDVQRGYISADKAHDLYGVAIKAGAFEVDATAQLRAHRGGRGTGYDVGPERMAYEAVWTEAHYDQLTAIMLALPVHWRHFVKAKIFEEMARITKAGKPADFAQALAAARARYPDIPAIKGPQGSVAKISRQQEKEMQRSAGA